MSESSKNSGSKLQLVGGFLLFVWIGGAVIAGIYHNYAQKRQCIQDEGWLKGWLWCSTETPNSFGFNMLRGLVWPIEVAQTPSVDATKQVLSAPRLTQEQFDTSRIGTAYSCWAVALRTERKDDAKALAQMLLWTRKQDPAAADMHGEYLHYAGLHLQQIESGKGFDSYYQISCTEPVARVKQAIDQGMIK